MHVIYNPSKIMQVACRIKISVISNSWLKEENWFSSSNSRFKKISFYLVLKYIKVFKVYSRQHTYQKWLKYTLKKINLLLIFVIFSNLKFSSKIEKIKTLSDPP